MNDFMIHSNLEQALRYCDKLSNNISYVFPSVRLTQPEIDNVRRIITELRQSLCMCIKRTSPLPRRWRQETNCMWTCDEFGNFVDVNHITGDITPAKSV